VYLNSHFNILFCDFSVTASIRSCVCIMAIICFKIGKYIDGVNKLKRASDAYTSNKSPEWHIPECHPVLRACFISSSGAGDHDQFGRCDRVADVDRWSVHHTSVSRYSRFIYNINICSIELE